MLSPPLALALAVGLLQPSTRRVRALHDLLEAVIARDAIARRFVGREDGRDGIAFGVDEVERKAMLVRREVGGHPVENDADAGLVRPIDELGKTLSEQGIEPLSDFMYMGYNAPWDVINRRNEVAVEVAWKR